MTSYNLRSLPLWVGQQSNEEAKGNAESFANGLRSTMALDTLHIQHHCSLLPCVNDPSTACYGIMKSLVRIRLLFVVLCVLAMQCFSFTAVPNNLVGTRHPLQTAPTSLTSSFFEEPEEEVYDDGDNEDDDDYEEMDDAAVAKFRQQYQEVDDISSVDELISFATAKASEEESTDWAKPQNKIEAGTVLVANPAKFCADFEGSPRPSSSLLSKFGLTLPPPADLGPDRRADLLPVLVLLERHALRGSQAVLLNRRTGYLLGDLEQQTAEGGAAAAPKLGAFMIQPLWFGGTSAGSEETSTSGLDMLHLCPAVKGAKQLTSDGLYWGGDPSQAQDAMNDPSLDRAMSGFDFKFFVQSTRWLPLQVCIMCVRCYSSVCATR